MKLIVLYPHYSGQVSLASARHLYVHARDQKTPRGDIETLSIADANSSLLPHTFNVLLSMALDARDRGEATHCVMLHSDIEPQAGWIDALVTEYRRARVDLLSVVVPIKDQDVNPRTSTAVFDAANPWEPKRYIYVRDRETMPRTFRPTDVCGEGEVLGINTGLWIADLTKPWWDDFAFGFYTRIVKTEQGHTPQIVPEDWALSFHLARHGAPYAATWAIRVKHHGSAEWPNR